MNSTIPDRLWGNIKTLLPLVFFTIIAVFGYSQEACAVRAMHQNFDQGSGHTRTGWTWSESANKQGHPGWTKDGAEVFDYGYPTASFFQKGSTNFGTTAIIDVTDRAPSTTTGGSLKYYREPWDAASKMGWYLWYDGWGLGRRGYTDSNTDRMSFYVKMINGEAMGREFGVTSWQFNLYLGTYTCWNDGADGSGTMSGKGCPYEGPGNLHFYHQLNINSGSWVHVELDNYPQFRRSWAPNPGPDPTMILYGKPYFEHMNRFYLEVKGRQDDTASQTVNVDEIEFYSTADTVEPNQNSSSISSITVGYFPGIDEWEMSWSDNLSDVSKVSTFEIRWSTKPITNANYDSATVAIPLSYTVDGQYVRKIYNSTYIVWTNFKIPDNIEASNSKLYFAVRDVSTKGKVYTSGFRIDRGDSHDAPTTNIRIIDYNLSPDLLTPEPSNLMAQTDTSDRSAVNLLWTRSNLSNLTGYKVYYDTDAGAPYNGTGLTEGNSPVAVGSSPTTLSGLQEGNTYRIATTAYSSATETATTNEVMVSFNDPATSMIKNVATSNVTTTTADISWTTTASMNSWVEYGTTNSYGSVSQYGFNSSHLHSLSGLATGTQYHYRVVSSDSTGNLSVTGDMTFTTSVDPLLIGTVSMPKAYSSISYSNDLSATGGMQPLSWSITSGSLPAGFALNSATGTISGITTSTGDYSFTVAVTDSTGTPANKALTLTVDNKPLRVIDNLVALYLFDESSGSVVQDQSGVGSTMDLTFNSLSAIKWISGRNGIEFTSASAVTASNSSKMFDMLKASGTMTMEVWLQPANLTQGGPARAVSFSASPQSRNVTIGQETTNAQARVRTTATTVNGNPYLTSSNGPLTTGIHHIVTTYDGNTNRLYIDGSLNSSLVKGGDFGNWDSTHTFLLGNEVTMDRPWLGKIFGVAVYSRELTVAEIQQNYNAGSSMGISSGGTPPPPTPVSISTGSLPDAAVGKAYSTTLLAADGTPAYQWTLSTGSLPAGISLDQATGVISGTPTTSASQTFTVTVTDSLGVTASKQLTILIKPAPPGTGSGSLTK